MSSFFHKLKKLANPLTVIRHPDQALTGEIDPVFGDYIHTLLHGPSDAAARAAAAAEAERQAQIQASYGKINGIFDDPSRGQQINAYLASTQKFLRDDLDRQYGDQGRQAEFALARTGLAGGSRDVDLHAQQRRTYLKGILQANQRAQGAAADVRSGDEELHRSLLSLASNGVNVGDASQQALYGLQSGIANSRAQLQQQGLGDVFSQFADVYDASRVAALRNKSAKFGGISGDEYPSIGYSGSV